jgi:hypothetical protein
MNVTELENGFEVGIHIEWSKRDTFVHNCFVRVETPTAVEEIRPAGWGGLHNAQAFHVSSEGEVTRLYDCTCREAEDGALEGEFVPIQFEGPELEIEGDEVFPGRDLAQKISEDRDGVVAYFLMEVSDYDSRDTSFEFFYTNIFQNGEIGASDARGYE